MDLGTPENPVEIKTKEDLYAFRFAIMVRAIQVIGEMPLDSKEHWARVPPALTLSGEWELWKFRVEAGNAVLLERKVDVADAPQTPRAIF